jgi:RNA polymerase sigma-70 factor (ECF subfamily)
MNRVTYARLLRHARAVSRRADEAEDVLQVVLLAAVQAGRIDFEASENQRWVYGALRKRAAFEARSALRRRAREATLSPVETTDTTTAPDPFIDTLPPALKRTARLALGGHSRAEIAHLLRLSDTALRQRITQIRRRWRATGGAAIHEMPGLSGTLPFGLIRRALMPAMLAPDVRLGSHDPDGHLFVISDAHKTRCRGNKGCNPSKEI